jgi:cytosine/adenosine deaminase-related metal-dependent hydrolase
MSPTRGALSPEPHGGFVNAHTHLYSGLVPLEMPRPATPPRTFVEILQTIWWRLDRAIDETTLRAAARLYVAEALLAGTIAVVDHHESPNFISGSLDVLADACQELGIRAVLCYGATERNGGRREARCGLAECRRFALGNRRPLVRGIVGLHASFTVSDDTIREAGELCRDLGAVLHVHVAEDHVDVEDARQRGYAGPLERLHALGALPGGSILAHGVHLTREQVQMAAELGCWLVQNPRSNRNNKVGYPAALAASPLVALGTDGFPADMRAEFATLAECAREHGEDAGLLEARLLAGERLITERFGAAAPTEGARALAREGKLVTADIEEIRADAEEQARRLWTKMRSVDG